MSREIPLTRMTIIGTNLDEVDSQNLFDCVNGSKTIYVKYIGKDIRRNGTIGKASISGFDFVRRNRLVNGTHLSLYVNRVSFDDRKNVLNYTYYYDTNWAWIPDYEGETVYVFDKNASEKLKDLDSTTDKFGREIKAGDFVNCVLFAYEGGHAAGSYFGTVDRIDHTGIVWVKIAKLFPKQRSSTTKVKSTDLIIKVDDELMDTLLLARLSS